MSKKFLLAGSSALLAAVLVATLAIGVMATSDKVDSQAQTIEATVEGFAYPNITVEVNKPVRINFNVGENVLNGCNNEIVIPEWSIRKKLSVGDNYVEFTPTETGTFTYSCWMGMLRGSITVVDSGEGTVGSVTPEAGANGSSICPMFGGGSGSDFSGGAGGGCCAGGGVNF